MGGRGNTSHAQKNYMPGERIVFSHHTCFFYMQVLVLSKYYISPLLAKMVQPRKKDSDAYLSPDNEQFRQLGVISA